MGPVKSVGVLRGASHEKEIPMITTHALSVLILALAIAFLIIVASHVSHDFALRRVNARIDALEAATSGSSSAAE